MPVPDQSLSWSLPGGVTVACSAAVHGDMRQADLRAAWLADVGAARHCVVPRQVHGAVVVDATASADDLASADGVVSADGTLAVGSYGADCPGLCIVAGTAIGIAHCGWRGTAGGIVGRLVAHLRRVVPGMPPARWSALIGPGISGPRYEVDAPVLTARDWPMEALAPARPGRAQLDLATVIARDLRTAEVGDVRLTGICTHDDRRLWSFRRCGAGQVQLLAAWRG